MGKTLSSQEKITHHPIIVFFIIRLYLAPYNVALMVRYILMGSRSLYYIALLNLTIVYVIIQGAGLLKLWISISLLKNSSIDLQMAIQHRKPVILSVLPRGI